MDNQLKEAAGAVFAYPDSHDRWHGPAGYADYRSFKPWLRDEFAFRCVYCLCRERWEPNGHRGFSADHIQPRVVRPDLICEYGNLLYACVTCNSARHDSQLQIDPNRHSLSQHLRMTNDGKVEPRTKEGAQLIEICQLNRATLAGFRRRLLVAVAALIAMDSVEAESVLRDMMAYPGDLPNLAALRPPGGNQRPDGIRHCCSEQRRRGELPDFY